MTMREKIARAICDRFARKRYPRMMDGSRAGYVNENWPKWTEHADAVLDAMREPTEEMWEAAAGGCCAAGWLTDWQVLIGAAKAGA